MKVAQKLFCTAAVILYICSCTKQDPVICEEVTYAADVVPIIQTHCAISGCHVAGFTPGDYNQYIVLKQKVDSGTFQLLVLNLQTMPPDETLTENELDILQCWVDAGAPEN